MKFIKQINWVNAGIFTFNTLTKIGLIVLIGGNLWFLIAICEEYIPTWIQAFACIAVGATARAIHDKIKIS